MVFADKYGSIYDPLSPLRTIRLGPSLSGFLKFKLYKSDVHNDSLNRYLNEEVENLLFVNIMRNIMENKLSNNINNFINSSVSTDEAFILYEQ